MWTSATASHGRRNQTEGHRADISSSSAIHVSTEQLSICSTQEQLWLLITILSAQTRSPAFYQKRRSPVPFPLSLLAPSHALTLHTTIGSPRTCGPGLLLLYQVTAPGCCVRCTRDVVTFAERCSLSLKTLRMRKSGFVLILVTSKTCDVQL